MHRLKTLLPDPAAILSLHPSDLAGYILQVLVGPPRLDPQFWHWRNFCSNAAGLYGGFREGPPAHVAQAFSEAWSWLEINGLLARNIDQSEGWFAPTKLGADVATRQEFAAFLAAQALPEDFLHPSLLPDVRPLFLQQRYDMAVFGAFHRLEVAMREAARLGDEWIGTKFAARAFNPEDGKLTDKDAEASERQALMNMMVGALGSYKNPQSHRKVGLDASAARDLIIMASQLLKIVDERSLITPPSGS